jgi:glycosyltransferase involved in cell wall biosynthesis
MQITVIVCTYNRCQSLAKTLDSLAASQLPEVVDWEVLVVDNNSNDQTREVVEGFCTQYRERFRYAFEPRQGKSYALNTAVRESRGDILAFTDDDVTVEPTWLANLAATLEDGQWAGAGGRTLPAWNITPPRWLALNGEYSNAGMLYAHFDLGDRPRQLDRAPYGANMAFRRAMFEKHGRFRTDLGPGPSSDIPRFNEDTEFGRRLMATGEKLRYEPSAVVYHVVPAERVRKEYFLRSWFEFGRSYIREVGKRPDVWGIRRHYLSIPGKIVTLSRQMLRWILALNPQRRFHARCSVWMTAGRIFETYRQSRGHERSF